MNIPFFAINLERSSDRWEILKERADQLGIEIYRVNGIDGQKEPEESWIDVDSAAFGRMHGRMILPGEYGCYRSHLKALQAVEESGSPYAVILEDDALPDERTLRRIQAFIRAAPDLDILKLVNHRASMFARTGITEEGDEFGRTIHGPQGSAAAYLVSQSGARRLRKSLAVMKLPWDVALERPWASGVNFYTARQNILSLFKTSPSLISPNGYKASKLTLWRRLPTAFWRLIEYFRRAAAVSTSVEYEAAAGSWETEASSLPWGQDRNTATATIVGGLLLLFVSAVWVESDLYRYAGLILVGIAGWRYFARDLWTTTKPLIGWIGLSCFGWGFYVAARLAFQYFGSSEGKLGSAEGIYLFPLLYTLTGYALFCYVRRPMVLAACFIGISFLTLIFAVDFDALMQGERSWSRFHNNPIHAAVAHGIIVLCSLSFFSHLLVRNDMPGTWRRVLLTVSGATFLLGLIDVYILQSKGVWLSLAIALPFLVLLIVSTQGNRAVRLAASGAFAAAVLMTILLWDGIEAVAGETFRLGFSLLDSAADKGLWVAIDETLAISDLPLGFHERLTLWANGLHLWLQAPIFGHGPAWLAKWNDGPFPDLRFTLMHNGYLEILVRYGLFGLTFFVGIYCWFTRQVWKAWRARLIAAAAVQCYTAVLVFFALTMLTNSNNRLALGESLMWFLAAIGFWCYYRLQAAGLVRPGTVA